MKRSAVTTVVAVVFAMVLAACGSKSSPSSAGSSSAGPSSASSSSAGSSSAGPSAAGSSTSGSSIAGSGSAGSTGAATKLSVGSSPAILNVSLYYAAQSGIFAKNGLAVTPKVIASGQQAIPQLLNGQIQFAASDPVGVINAIAHNLAVEFVAPAGFPGANPAGDITGLLVKSSITKASDLNGKTVAVNAIGGILQLAAESVIDSSGGNSSSIKFVVLSLPQMAAAVKAGTVDGAVASEPFLSQGVKAGLKDLSSVAATAAPEVPTVVYMTSKSYATSHPDIVKSFAASLMEANTYLTAHPEEIRTVAVKSTGTSADILAGIQLPAFKPEPLSLDALNQLQTLMVKYKLLDKPIDLSADLAKTGN
ncbi:MAG: hypothetical protein QOG69_2749 [Actinomycetota bacterium]|nr:hypothetical protein [Actinomycetota bacterium]